MYKKIMLKILPILLAIIVTFNPSYFTPVITYASVANSYASDYTGFYDNGKEWLYIKNGQPSNTTGIITGTVNGIKDKWYVNKGIVKTTKTGFVHCTVNGDKAYWYIKSGRLSKSTGVFEGTINSVIGKYHVVSGKAETERTDFIYCTVDGEKAYWYFKNGLFKSTTGFVYGTIKDKTGYWHIKNGKVETTRTGFIYATIEGKKAYWYISKGCAVTSTGFRNGTIKGITGTYYIYQGRGQPSKTGFVNVTYNGEKAKWYVKNGLLQTSFTGTLTENNESQIIKKGQLLCSIPEYSGTDVVVINNDKPFFKESEKEYNGTYINLSELDELGRCQEAMAVVGQETEPTESRGDISSVYPTGWVQRKYNDSWLYNRSHLLMFALTGLNDDNRNLITGTEYFNQTLMLGYESMALWTVDNMNAHIVYRVTPVFDGDNLVAKGVLMEAYCIEYPEDCEFCVFVYNIANPSWSVEIDYATGNSWQNTVEESSDYILNINSKKFHLPTCTGASTMSAKNRQEFHGTKTELLNMGYSPCGMCNP